MKKSILFVLSTLVFYEFANAQIRFSASFSSSGDCNGSLGGKVMLTVAQGECDYYNNERTFTSCEECNQFRDGFLSRGGTNTQYGCTIHYYATPCMPCGGNGSGGESFGETNVLGLLEGTSVFSSNPANEVQDWAEDNEELLKILGGEKPVRHEFVSDNGYVFSAHMPGTIKKFVLDDEPEVYGAADGVHVPDNFFDKPLRLDTGGDYSIEDFKMIDTDQLQQVRFENNPQKLKNYDDYFDDTGDVIKMMISFAAIPAALTVFTADLCVNLWIENAKMAFKLSRGEYVKMDEVTSTIAYNTLNKSMGDALSILTSRGLIKAKMVPQQLTESTFDRAVSIASGSYNIIDRHTNSKE